MLGVLLLAVAWQLATVALDSRDRPLVVGMAALAVLTNVGVAFLAGVAGHALLRRARRRSLT
jgi:hypothetical protein